VKTLAKKPLSKLLKFAEASKKHEWEGFGKGNRTDEKKRLILADWIITHKVKTA